MITEKTIKKLQDSQTGGQNLSKFLTLRGHLSKPSGPYQRIIGSSWPPKNNQFDGRGLTIAKLTFRITYLLGQEFIIYELSMKTFACHANLLIIGHYS